MPIDQSTFEERVRAVDWSALEGAYGRSDGSTRGDDVAATLIGLARGEPEADDDVLLGHVWHQGTIFPVTPAVVPFLWDLVLAGPAEEDDVEDVDDELLHDLRGVLWVIHQSALQLDSLGAAVFEASRRRRGPPEEWSFDDGSDFYQLIRIVVPEWRPGYLRKLIEADETVSEAAWAVLGSIASLPDAITHYAAARIGRSLADDTSCRAMMAVVAARVSSLPLEVKRRVHEALASIPKGADRIESDDDLWIWMPPLPEVNAFELADEWRADCEASVFFVGPSSIGITFVPSADVTVAYGVVFKGGLRANITVRFVPPGVTKGQSVYVGFHSNSRVRVLQWATRDGRTARAHFDDDGNVAHVAPHA